MALVCLALNAAYLRFDPFRCREIVKDYATKLFENHRDRSDASMNQYRLIQTLSEGRNYNQLTDNKPDSVDVIFLVGVDMWAAGVMLVVSALFFIISVPLLALGNECSTPPCDDGFWFWFCIFTLFIVVSLGVIFRGRGVVDKMKEKLDRADRELTPGGEEEVKGIQDGIKDLAGT